MTYTPGLQVKASTLYRVQRMLPIPGQVLVQSSQSVTADQMVACSEQPGDIIPVNVANALNISPAEVPAAMKKSVGDAVVPGELLARSKGIFGYFQKDLTAPGAATVEAISQVTGQVILRGPPMPVQVPAFVSGTIVEVIPDYGVVIETPAAFIQGIFGLGGERNGVLQGVADDPQADLMPDQMHARHQGCVLFAGGRIHGAAVLKACELGVSALIGGGIDDQDLKDILGYDLGVAITGSEKIGVTVIVTEGFGEITMARRTFDLLRSCQGRLCSVNGATQIRAGVLRPEIVIPDPQAVPTESSGSRIVAEELQVGSQVRLIRDPYFGELGQVTSMPVTPQLLESGSRARVLEVKCQTGKKVIVPRANVEVLVE